MNYWEFATPIPGVFFGNWSDEIFFLMSLFLDGWYVDRRNLAAQQLTNFFQQHDQLWMDLYIFFQDPPRSG